MLSAEVTDWVLLVTLVTIAGLLQSAAQWHFKSKLLGRSQGDSLRVWGFFLYCVLGFFVFCFFLGELLHAQT